MAEPAATQPEPPKGALARLGELTWQALPAIASAIGVVGFVTLVGGAIQWVRFYAAGLPADQAVRAMPEAELVTIGAVSLVGYAILGLFVLLLLYVLDSNGNASIGTLRGLVVLAVLELLVTLLVVDLELEVAIALALMFAGVGILTARAVVGLPDRLRAREARKAADGALRTAWESFSSAQYRHDDLLSQVDPGRRNPDDPADGPEPPVPASPDLHRSLLVALRQATLGLRKARREWNFVLDDWVEAAPDEEKEHRRKLIPGLRPNGKDAGAPEGRPPAEALVEKALEPWKPRRKKRRSPDVLRNESALIALSMLAGASIVLVALGSEEERLLVVILAVVIVLAVTNFGLARATQRFAWYGAGALLSLIVFGAALNLGRTLLDPQVQPLALIRKSDGKPICGIYVTETDKRVYVGRVVGDEGKHEIGADTGSGRMFWVPTDDVDVVTVGPLQLIEDAEMRARLLTNEVVADRAEQQASSPKIKRTTVDKTTTRTKNGTTQNSTTDVTDVPAPAPAKSEEELKREKEEALEKATTDELTPCATPEITEKRVNKLKHGPHGVRSKPARHRVPPPRDP